MRVLKDKHKTRTLVKRLAVFLLLAILFSGNSFALTEICGVLDIPTSLIKSKSPYLLTGDLYVPSSSRLSIDAGVEILVAEKESCNETRQINYLDSQMVSIKVDGTFFILGNPDNPVKIRPQNAKNGQIRWYGIFARRKHRITMQVEYLQISGAHKAIEATDSKFAISNSIFQGNNTGLYLEDQGDLAVYNNVFTENLSAGIFIRHSRPKIVANVFYKNPNFGIWSDSYPKILIAYNNFWENFEHDCYHCPAGLGQLNQTNHRGDSADILLNIYKNPVFMGSLAEKHRKNTDLMVPTHREKVVDTVMQKMHAEAQNISAPAIDESSFRFYPSKYSPLIDAAPPDEFFTDSDESRGDIGISGGRIERTSKPFDFN